MEKVVVGMSGGVDSAVAAYLLKTRFSLESYSRFNLVTSVFLMYN